MRFVLLALLLPAVLVLLALPGVLLKVPSWHERRRTSWWYCPRCDWTLHDQPAVVLLNPRGFYAYVCVRCGLRCVMDLGGPAPWLMDWWTESEAADAERFARYRGVE